MIAGRSKHPPDPSISAPFSVECKYFVKKQLYKQRMDIQIDFRNATYYKMIVQQFSMGIKAGPRENVDTRSKSSKKLSLTHQNNFDV